MASAIRMARCDNASAAAGTRVGATKRHSLVSLVALGAAALLVFATLVALGAWQVDRLAWKLDLIAAVDARVHEPPSPVPPPATWPRVTAAADAYRHVGARGTFLPGEAAVQAVTERGGGFWVLAPLRTDAGFTVLVNRGFVPSDRRDPRSRPPPPSGETTVVGLLRLSEPGGAFLRSNDPAGDRWYSRDVAAIAAARHLGPVAPYFIDADASSGTADAPVGGLTVIAFPNNHLVYALTWFGLAAMLAGAAVWVIRGELRLRRSVT